MCSAPTPVSVSTDDIRPGIVRVRAAAGTLASFAVAELGSTIDAALARRPWGIVVDLRPLDAVTPAGLGMLVRVAVAAGELDIGLSMVCPDVLRSALAPQPGLIELFDLTRVSSNPAAFDTEKLTWLNERYIQSLGDDELAARCVHFLVEAGVGVDPGLLRRAMPLVKERMKNLSEVVALLRFLFSDDITPNEKAATILAQAPPGYLEEAATALEQTTRWEAEPIAETLDQLAKSANLSRTKGWQPIRAAVTGSNISPPLPESLDLLGRERTVARVRAAAG